MRVTMVTTAETEARRREVLAAVHKLKKLDYLNKKKELKKDA
ncbi:hypothetical protein [Paenibacillus xylanexedens]|nr:hypothetical protein [Paenibacillus xylanexedens]